MYRVNFDKDCFTVIEKKTGHEIKTFPHEKFVTSASAKALCKHLNSGGGFNGNTPDFFMQRIKVSENAY